MCFAFPTLVAAGEAHPPWRCVGIPFLCSRPIFRILASPHCLRAETRCSRSCSTNRCSCSRTTRRHSRSHCCSTDRPHGLTGESTFVNTKIVKSSSQTCFWHFQKNFRVAYATFHTQRHSTLGNALYSLTLVALTICPLKASRDPMYALVLDESKFVLAHDTPPSAYALLYDR